MWMTDEQIRKSYRLAAYPKSQIAVLAQLNACGQDDIRKIIDGMKVVPTQVDYGRERYQHLSEKQVQEMLDLHNKGLSGEQIAQITGVSERKISNKLYYIKTRAKQKAATGAGTPATATR